MHKPFIPALLALIAAAACESAATGPVVDPAATNLGEAINEPTDGFENEIEVE